MLVSDTRAFHLSIGRALRDNLDKNAMDKQHVLVTSHLIVGMDLMLLQEEKDLAFALSGQVVPEPHGWRLVVLSSLLLLARRRSVASAKPQRNSSRRGLHTTR